MNELPEDFKRHMAENKRKSLERCARVKKPQTNADRIRAMSDEELAQWICCHITECARCEGRRYDGQECEFRNGRSTGLSRWLKSPVEVDV